MIGVILAGGKGTRLHPLTLYIPKPMVPIINKPVMEYSIELFKKHGITNIVVTLQYMPEQIKEYFGDGSRFGVKLYYYVETTPLGTAGSIKNAEEFLDDTFLVISGDAITDFNLTKGIQFHREKQALATIFIKSVEDPPFDYGLVWTNDDGTIKRFIEKPSREQLTSNKVNTGIYIFEPHIFHYVRQACSLDFGNDIFPLLIKENAPLYGYEAEGYWADVGSFPVYRRTEFDLLNNKVRIPDVKKFKKIKKSKQIFFSDEPIS